MGNLHSTASVAVVALTALVSAPLALGAQDSPPGSPLTKANGLVMLDYQTIRINGYQPIDLMGFHFLNQFNDWLYLGVGGHAPLVKGEYGGFMAFDATVHAERRLFGPVSASVGASFGGGGGGKTVEQSKVISGSGGFVKTYAGIGYHFPDFSVGVNYSRIRFTNSAIDGSQFALYFQAPFSYAVGPYASAGRSFPQQGADAATPADNDTIVFGLDNMIQIDPKGSYRKTVNLVDAQYHHFLTNDAYVLFGGSVGYHGIVAYNQAYAGVGYRYRYADRIHLNAQVAVGSGGYAPERIDTGSGLLLYPKLSAQYLLTKNLGLSLSGGYLSAPRGSSRNYTVGAALAYHVSPVSGFATGSDSGKDTAFSGHRFHLFQQTEFKTKVGDRYQGVIRMLSGQVDNTLSDNVYIPVQGSIAYNSYFGFPGYGELLAGIGIQTKHSPDDRLQAFAQLLVGTNVHGLIAKPTLGLNYGLSDRLALYAQAGTTFSLDKLGLSPKEKRFSSRSVGLGLSYRFSLPAL